MLVWRQVVKGKVKKSTPRLAERQVKLRAIYYDAGRVYKISTFLAANSILLRTQTSPKLLSSIIKGETKTLIGFIACVFV